MLFASAQLMITVEKNCDAEKLSMVTAARQIVVNTRYHSCALFIRQKQSSLSAIDSMTMSAPVPE
jgi:hypothetical protein